MSYFSRTRRFPKIRYARNNFPIEIISNIVPTIKDREIERLRAKLKKDFHGIPGSHEHKLLAVRYQHLGLPFPPYLDGRDSHYVDEPASRSGRATPESRKPQVAWGWNQHIAEAPIDRFDGNFIRFDLPPACESVYYDFVKNIAAEMKTEDSGFASDMVILAQRTDAGDHVEIQQAFCRLANKIAQQAASIEPDRSFTIGLKDEIGGTPQVFVSRGATHVRENESDPNHHGPKESWIFPSDPLGHDQYKPDIILNYWHGVDISNVESPLWNQLAGAAKVQGESQADMMLPLIIQLFRYQTFMVKQHPACGELFTFTLCGDLLRAFYIDPSRYGSSRAMSFVDPADYEEIVKTILYFSGPFYKILSAWQPEDGMQIEIKDSEEQQLKYVLQDVKLLDSAYSLWGRRTTVWSCEADEAVNEQGKPVSAQGERLVIKLAWQRPHLKKHEAIVYGYISEKQRQGVALGAGLYIPALAGSITASDHPGRSNHVDIANWRTRSAMADGSGTEFFEATTLVTRCKRAIEVFGLQMEPRAFLSYFRLFFRLLRYLATCEIHYRDVNPGNILCDADTHSVCIVADFDFSRIGMLPRGSDPREARTQRLSPYHASLDDSRSGSLYFMCRRVQESLALQTAFESIKKELLKAERKAAEIPLNEAAARRYDNKKRELKEIRDQIEANSHTYIDDAESTVYNMLWIVARMKTEKDFPPPGMRTMHIMSEKIGIWGDAYGVSADMEYSESWALAMEKIVAAINKAQGLVQQDHDRSRTGPLACELACYDEIDGFFGEAIDAIDGGAD